MRVVPAERQPSQQSRHGAGRRCACAETRQLGTWSLWLARGGRGWCTEGWQHAAGRLVLLSGRPGLLGCPAATCCLFVFAQAASKQGFRVQGAGPCISADFASDFMCSLNAEVQMRGLARCGANAGSVILCS